MYKQYDKVQLTTGEVAWLVEILGDNEMYIADIDRADGSTETEYVNPDQIEKKLPE